MITSSPVLGSMLFRFILSVGIGLAKWKDSLSHPGLLSGPPMDP